ncbi:energy transducer TonB [Hymenobacter taeanensis]|uniref:Energy transducer TonB n=1 Tax=Hymenobacter taeanensis TaxID=2735321 RepID=A0A6M6BEB0_9BACT|nr:MULTISPECIES: energy transducer TonB [Hymenobacter]QJX46566.1 energy transducer TonB [Hymenobacter taeanensis]UOQ80424.1 energy transducer TonB [Hymenobacter sp. 5414T-23]
MKKLLPLLVLALLLGVFSAQAQKMRKNEWESGLLEKGEKVGVWEYYSYTRDGRQVITQKYDHTAKKLVFFRDFDDVAYPVQTTAGTWNREHLTQPPLFLGGDAALAPFMSKLNYPAQAQSKNIQGKVVVAFVVDTLGRAVDHKVMLGIGGGCDEEALRVCRAIPNQWLPARIGGRAVVVQHELPFTFRLAK